MKRDIYEHLRAWSRSQERKPLILRGARQTGKSYALQWLGETCYDSFVLLNFEKDPLLATLFQETLDPKILVTKISAYTGKEIEAGRTLLIFDEIQESNAALNALKYFCEEAPEYHVVAAGSLLGVKMSQGRSFPVGKVDFLDLFPMTFEEFLDANNGTALRALLEGKRDLLPLADAFHQKFLTHLTNYFIVGGMPEVVAGFAGSGSFAKARHIQETILRGYQNDFAKHAPASDIPKLSRVWGSIPSHLSRENKRFIFSAVRRGARGRDYESALAWLNDAGLIHYCHRLAKAAMPLRSYEDPDIFKVYVLDIGLLGALADLPFDVLYRGSRVFHEFHGAFIENYVAQQLVSKGMALHYWESSGNAEIDFVIQSAGTILPLEAKAGINVKSKSLRSFRDRYPELTRACRVNLLNFQQAGQYENYPLYAVLHCTRDIASMNIQL